jgi:hypothetical protein
LSACRSPASFGEGATAGGTGDSGKFKLLAVITALTSLTLSRPEKVLTYSSGSALKVPRSFTCWVTQDLAASQQMMRFFSGAHSQAFVSNK